MEERVEGLVGLAQGVRLGGEVLLGEAGVAIVCIFLILAFPEKYLSYEIHSYCL